MSKESSKRNSVVPPDDSVGFIGAGNMAQAIAFRMLDSGLVLPSNMIVSATSDRNLELWKQRAVSTTIDNSKVVKNATIVFIAVKPQYFKTAAHSISNISDAKVKCFVSVMAGKTLKNISATLGQNYKHAHIIRVMPNTPCMVGIGCSVMCSINSDSNYNKVVYSIMSSLGLCEQIDEVLFNSVSGLCGSGPAYMYMVMEALADGAVKKGVTRDMAMNMAAQVMKGAAEMVLSTKKHPGLLKDEVCSPGGTTICGVAELERGSVRSAFINAISAASDRADELTAGE
ncbi:pyrroline-5-carboxylate reductase [Cimex lectularius]|uniref:Pyrroline-5-carboxylate reductase n=1 Tax=Cimex lectularius TaxID=79782 RepID=A0A8I6SDL2_CIMLE|nr:pyrroline-5-carboxylate reductase [Cimex lectularius]